jgi:hypothetical protein
MFDLTATTLDLEREALDKYAYTPPKSLLGCVEGFSNKCAERKGD